MDDSSERGNGSETQRPWLLRLRRIFDLAVVSTVIVATTVLYRFHWPPSGEALAELPTAQLTEATGKRAAILFGGDTHFGEGYLASSAEPDFLHKRGYGYPVARLLPLLRSAELTILNLETPLTARHSSALQGKKSYVHRGDPVEVASQLSAMKVAAVSLANNHAMDFLEPGLADTIAALDARAIRSFGAGPTLVDSARVYRHDIRFGDRVFRLAVIGAFERRWRYWRNDFYASSLQGGSYCLYDATIADQIGALKKADPSLFVVVFPHWGRNYRWRTPLQQELGQAIIDAGADLILGHGSHVFQEAERYAGRWIIHGLGNFVFLSQGRYARHDIHPYSMVARLELDDQPQGIGVKLRLYFIASDNRRTGYQPHLLEGEQLQQAVNAFLTGGNQTDASRSELAAAFKRERDTIGEGLVLELGTRAER